MDKKPASTELPVPSDFPVTWENEVERDLLWRWDDIHSPLPSSPMALSVSEVGVLVGSAKASEELGQPIHGLRKIINGYSYSASTPRPATSGPDHPQDQAVSLAITNTRHRWDTEFLPAIIMDLQHMLAVNLGSLSDGKLIDHLDKLLEIQRHHWYIHFMVVLPMSLAIERMSELYKQIMGQVPDGEAYLLLQGIDNKSLEVDRAIQKLADQARGSQELLKIFADEPSPLVIISQLSRSTDGRDFLLSLDEFLSVYGYRPTGFDFVFPSWKEDPSFVIINVKSYLASTPRDLEEQTAAQAAEAQRLLNRLLDTVKNNEEMRLKFLEAYETARGLWPLKEDHAFYIDQASMAMLRLPLVELGYRLVARGILSAEDDIFYLTLDELRATMKSCPSADLANVTASRRKDRERFIKVIPPLFLGALPDEDKLSAQPELQAQVIQSTPYSPEKGAGVLRGVAGSKGVATGIARVVRSPDEFARVRPGDVLVCTSTSPTWTPLFGSIGALVSDSGGALSHTAIVAREYGLPAVVGARSATSSISDGQVVTVDGNLGVVSLH